MQHRAGEGNSAVNFEGVSPAPSLNALGVSPARAGLTLKALTPLFANFSDASQQAAAPILQELQNAHTQQKATTQALDARLHDKGDPARGAAAFAKASCIACHRAKC